MVRMKLHEIVSVLESIAPTSAAESWDNVGLLVGDPQREVTRAMLCIDYTPAEAGCELIVAYHPPIFQGLKRIAAGSLIDDAIRRGVAIFSPHTALDVAPGGTNDVLADAIGLVERRPLRLPASQAREVKLIVFVPHEHVDRISEAMFQAGAGWIGKYSHCSFRIPGQGTFLGEEGSNPTVGQRGRMEIVEEMRVEMIVPIAKVAEVVGAMRRAHPYEEPAFDLQQLMAPPSGSGQGRIGTMPPTPRRTLIERIKRELELPHLLVAGPTDGNVTTAAVCAGSCGDLLDDALSRKAELYLTGELRHHDALKAAAAGCTVVCTLHSNSERAALKHLASRLAESATDATFLLSKADRDPFAIV
jgi:dinuclear metal center YbgI/SA1388 family protein